MTQVDIDATIHEFISKLYFEAQADGMISMRVETDCQHIKSVVQGKKFILDPMVELFKPEASLLNQTQDLLPHRACPFLFAALRGMQVEANMEKPGRFTIDVRLLKT